MSCSSSRFHDLKSHFEHYAFLCPRRIEVTNTAKTATVHMGAMIQVSEADASTTIRYRIAALSWGNDEAISQIVTGMQNYLPKDATLKIWEKDFNLRSPWTDKALTVAAWAEAIVSAGKGLAGSNKSLVMLDKNESSFRDQLVSAHQGSRSDASAPQAVTGDSKSVTDKLANLCGLVTPPIIFRSSHFPPTQQETPNSSSAQEMWLFPYVSLSADERDLVPSWLRFTLGFKPEHDPVKTDFSMPKAADSFESWRRGIASNSSQQILAGLELYREALIEVATPKLVQYDLHRADDSEFGPYVSNSEEARLIDLDE